MQRMDSLEEGYQVLQRAGIANKTSAQMIEAHPECIKILLQMEKVGVFSGTKEEKKLAFANLIHCIKYLKSENENKTDSAADLHQLYERISAFLTPNIHQVILKLILDGNIIKRLNGLIALNLPLTADFLHEIIHHPSGYIGMQGQCNQLFPSPEEAQKEFLYLIKKVTSGAMLERLRCCISMDSCIGPQTWANSKNFRVILANIENCFYLLLGFRLLTDANLLEQYREQLTQHPALTINLEILSNNEILTPETAQLAFANHDFSSAKSLCCSTRFLNSYERSLVDPKGFLIQLLNKPRLCYALRLLDVKLSETPNMQQGALLRKMQDDVLALLNAASVKFAWVEKEKPDKPTISSRISFFNAKPMQFDTCWQEIRKKYQIQEAVGKGLKKVG